MQKDIYAIFESYLGESQGQFVSGPGVNVSANYTTRNISNATAAGARSPLEPSEQAEETPLRRKIKKEVDTLRELVHRNDFSSAIVYCNALSKSLQSVYNEK